jgi:hypothetical protein
VLEGLGVTSHRSTSVCTVVLDTVQTS